MDDFKLSATDQGILLTHLRACGVPAPENCQEVSYGQNAVCFIGDVHVLKVFRHSAWARREVIDGFAQSSNDTYAHLALAAEEIMQRGVVKVPRLLRHGCLPASLRIDNNYFLSWQLMSRVEGKPVPPDWYKAEDAAKRVLEQMTLIAAHIHVDAPQDKGPARQYPLFKRNILPQQLNDRLRLVLSQLDKDMQALNGNGLQNTNVLLHGDLHSGNILDNGSTLSVIDWDDQGYGPPSYDLNFISDWPNRIEELCTIYNGAAKYPVDPNFMIAKGYNDALSTYHYINGCFDMSATVKCEILKDKREKLFQCAEQLTLLTGQSVYTDYAESLPDDDPLRGFTTKQDKFLKPEPL